MRPARRSRARRLKSRAGFSLTEILVAMTLLSVILMSLARVTFQMAASSRTNDLIAKRNATLIEEANKFNAMQFAALASVSEADATYTFGDFKFTRRLEITDVSTSHRTIKIVIVPWIGGVATESKKDSVFVTRTQSTGSPLCVGC